jgi:protein-L-isoaspartate(D-aspartate) O-methyltransferase
MTQDEFDLARKLMVDGQLRPSKVSDRRILDAMRRLPRERFLPAAQADRAYIDADVKLGGGRVLMQPLVQARLVQLAAPREGEAALVVGSGCGFGAALLASCGAHVTALEDDEALSALARAACEGMGLDFVSGPLAEGWADAAPYDLVLIDGAVREIPEAIGRQVAAHGRLVTVLAPAGGGSAGVLAEHSTTGLRARAMFDASVALLPGLIRNPGFVF